MRPVANVYVFFLEAFLTKEEDHLERFCLNHPCVLASLSGYVQHIRMVSKVYLDLNGNKVCKECGSEFVYIGEEYVRRELKFIPAKMTVIEYYSRNYKCPECEANEFPSIYKGKEGKSHGLYGMISAETLSWLIYQKFCNSLPFYRQEKDWKQYGVSITRATMAGWVIKN